MVDKSKSLHFIRNKLRTDTFELVQSYYNQKNQLYGHFKTRKKKKPS